MYYLTRHVLWMVIHREKEQPLALNAFNSFIQNVLSYNQSTYHNPCDFLLWFMTLGSCSPRRRQSSSLTLHCLVNKLVAGVGILRGALESFCRVPHYAALLK